MKLQSAFELINETQKPLVIWIEPLGEDYTLLSNDKINIVPSDEEFNSLEFGRPALYYQVDNIVVYTFFDYEVYINDVQVKCGHQRLSKDNIK